MVAVSRMRTWYCDKDVDDRICKKERNLGLRATRHLFQSGPKLVVDDIPLRVFGQKVKQKLRLDVGEAATIV